MRGLGASSLAEGARMRRRLRACTTLCGGDAYPDTQDLAQPRHGSGGHVYHPLIGRASISTISIVSTRLSFFHIGFTGIRQGMTERQKSALRDLMASNSGVVLHHGDAIGADAEAHDIAVELDCGIVIHPPAKVTQRAFKIAWLIRGLKPYLDRNKVIVRETSFLIAAPAMEIEQLRSGTWSTVRHARRMGCSEHLLVP